MEMVTTNSCYTNIAVPGIFGHPVPAKVVSDNAGTCNVVVAIVASFGTVGGFPTAIVLVVVVAVTRSLPVVVVVSTDLVCVVGLEPSWVLMAGVAVACGRANEPDFMANSLDTFREAALQHP